MPTNILGYDMLENEWIGLPVPNIEPIHWRKLPLEDLVLPDETKRVVRAIVTIRASSIKTKRDQRMRNGFDIIPGKRNGLIMLFHGSPRTGKTLIAESIAEIAEMPLYRLHVETLVLIRIRWRITCDWRLSYDDAGTVCFFSMKQTSSSRSAVLPIFKGTALCQSSSVCLNITKEF
jgi:hypothetical protein